MEKKMRMNNAKNTEDKLLLDSSQRIVGRKTAGAGPAEELTGADVAEQLPAATPSTDGKMTKEQAQSVANSAVAGSNGHVQFNNNGSLGADSNFIWDNNNKRLGIGTTSPLSEFHLYSSRIDGLGYAPQLLIDASKGTGQGSTVACRRENNTRQLLFSFLTGSLTASDGFIGTLSNKEKAIYIFTDSGNSTAFGFDDTLGFRVGTQSNILSGLTGACISPQGGGYFSGDISIGTSSSTAKLTTSGGSVVDYGTFTTDATLTGSSKSCAAINPSGTGVVITMHLSPTDAIKQRTVNVSAFAVTLGRNGQKMAGLEANYMLPAYTAIDWQYYGATIGWLPISISTW